MNEHCASCNGDFRRRGFAGSQVQCAQPNQRFANPWQIPGGAIGEAKGLAPVAQARFKHLEQLVARQAAELVNQPLGFRPDEAADHATFGGTKHRARKGIGRIGVVEKASQTYPLRLPPTCQYVIRALKMPKHGASAMGFAVGTALGQHLQDRPAAGRGRKILKRLQLMKKTPADNRPGLRSDGNERLPWGLQSGHS